MGTMKSLYLFTIILVLILSGCARNASTNKLVIIDGCSEEYFVYSEDLGVCEKKVEVKGTCDNRPLAEKLKECEESQEINIPEDVDVFCKEKTKNIDSSTYQYEELVKNIKNNCLHNFAIATRNPVICEGISYTSHQEICRDDAEKVK